jgi:hypothetical protein
VIRVTNIYQKIIIFQCKLFFARAMTVFIAVSFTQYVKTALLIFRSAVYVSFLNSYIRVLK